jgi:hypothetical protein
MTTQKYLVYRNDLKYKKFNNIDINKVNWFDDSIKNDFIDKDTDDIAFRKK